MITSNYKLQGFSKVVKRHSILLQIEAIAKIEVKARVFRLLFLIQLLQFLGDILTSIFLIF